MDYRFGRTGEETPSRYQGPITADLLVSFELRNEMKFRNQDQEWSGVNGRTIDPMQRLSHPYNQPR